MSFLEAWVASPMAGVLGWTVLHSLWQGAAIGGQLAAVLAARVGAVVAGGRLVLRRSASGRIYIMYGPPEEIDSHPAGKPHPFEEWKYRHLMNDGDNVVLWFVDWKGDRDFHLDLRPTHGQ